MKRAKLPAIISGADADSAVLRPELHDRRKPGPHRPGAVLKGSGMPVWASLKASRVESEVGNGDGIFPNSRT